MVKTHPCPICKKMTDNEQYRPFCSKRCADIDLGHWFNGDYAIPAENADHQEQDDFQSPTDEQTNE